MTKEKELHLVKLFPKILEDYGEKGGILTGIWCDDGWYDLVREFCQQVEVLNHAFWIRVKVKQIKEKFGFLRIYWEFRGDTGSNHENKTIQSIIDACAMKVETLSKHICEITGKHGTLCQFRNRYKTLSYEAVNSSVKYRNFQPVSNSLAEYWQELERKRADG